MNETAVLTPPGSSQCGELRSFLGAGGRRLEYRVVRARAERLALLYLHGIESHGGWFLAAAEGLAERGFTTYLVDRRGAGLNRALGEGDAESAATLLEDLRLFRVHARLDELALVGLSWGGKLALAAALDRPQGVRALALVTPGLVPRVDLPRLQKLRLALSLVLRSRARFDVPIEPEMFTRTPRFLRYIRSDPGRLERVTGRFLMASRALDRAIRARIDELDIPVLLLLAARDQIVDNERTRSLCERLPTGRLRVRVYEHATHSIQFDETAQLVGDLCDFLEEVAC